MTQSSPKSANGTAPPTVSEATEVVPKAKRRTFSAVYKQQILQDESPLKSGHTEESIYLLKEVYPWQASMTVNLN